MDDRTCELEGIAAELLSETGCDDPPVDAFELADCCGLVVRPWSGRGARLRGNTIDLNVRARPVRQHGLVAHELGHWAQRRARVPDTEEGARYLAGALMLPRRAFDRDLACSWSMPHLRERHPNASVEMIARRITQLRTAVATVIDAGRVTRRVVSPGLHGLDEASPWELDLAARSLEAAATVHEHERCFAFPVIDPPYVRVVVVCDAELLAGRVPPR